MAVRKRLDDVEGAARLCRNSVNSRSVSKTNFGSSQSTDTFQKTATVFPARQELVVGEIITLMSIKAPRVRADGDDDDKDPRIKIGFKIAPVPLNLSDKDRDLVGLGSYLVNAEVD